MSLPYFLKSEGHESRKGPLHNQSGPLRVRKANASALTKLGIAPVVDLPEVGRNLQDHPVIRLKYGCTKPLTVHSLVRVDRAALMMAQAILMRSGPATSFPVQAGGSPGPVLTSLVRTSNGTSFLGSGLRR